MTVKKTHLCIALSVAVMLSTACSAKQMNYPQDLNGEAPLPPIVYKQPGTSPLKLTASLSKESIITAANHVADWQLGQYDIRSNMLRTERRASGLPEGWIYGALNVGMMAWGKASQNQSYLQAMNNVSAVNGWRLGPRPYNADDHVMGDVYLDLYDIYGGAHKIAKVKNTFDWVMKNPSKVSMDFIHKEKEVLESAGRTFKDPWCKQRWCWADAIFMAPPVWAHLAKITGDESYLDFMDKEFWATTDYLYKPEEKLYLRDSRYFDRFDDDGKLIYWGRGNGWVYAGLARTLSYLPKDYPTYPKYMKIFQEMGARLVALQAKDGSWPSSLLEKTGDVTPESSGTGLLIYGLAWGINNGHLDKETYLPAVKNGWSSLIDSVDENGKIGWVQQVAYAPGSATAEDTQLYGTGAFLLAASELYKLAK